MRELIGAAAGHLRLLGGRWTAAVRGRLLPAHLDDPDVQSRSEPLRAAAHLPGRTRPPDDPAGGRDVPTVCWSCPSTPAGTFRSGRYPWSTRVWLEPAAPRPISLSSVKSSPAVAGARRNWRWPTQGTRWLLSFYGSTPSYRPVLDVEGWGDLQTELNSPVQGGPLGRDVAADRTGHARRPGRPRQPPGSGRRHTGTVSATVSMRSASTRPTPSTKRASASWSTPLGGRDPGGELMLPRVPGTSTTGSSRSSNSVRSARDITACWK